MYLFDAHIHSCAKWYEPFESALYHMDLHGVSKALLVPIHGDFDSEYVLGCKKKYPDRVDVCVQVNNDDPHAADELRRLRDAGAVGVRLLPDEPYPGEDPYALWRVAEEVGLAVSCYVNLPDCSDPAFHEALASMPRLKVVLEHLGGASRTTRYPQIQLEYLDRLLELAEFPNVYVKAPAFGEFYGKPNPIVEPTFGEAPAFFKQVFDAFGPRRLMWASDFPKCSNREGYGNALYYPLHHTPFYTEEDKEWVFGKTALSVWG